jgi:CDP-glucose 4,6-dehydratase
MNTAFWRGKRVFVTGHTGFKGGWLCFWLRHLGAEVCGYALPPTISQTLFSDLRLSGDIQSLFGDITDRDQLMSALVDFKADIVIHMAAQPLVQKSFHDPHETFNTNVMGAVNLLEAVRQCETVRSCVIITTDKCYQNDEWVWPYRENDRLGGDDPYSNSKACAELVTHSYYKSFFSNGTADKPTCALATARAGNVIGGGDWADDRLIPDLVRALNKNEKLNLRNPKATRPWQFVMEPLRGYLTLAEKLYEAGQDYTGGWNFGPKSGETRSVEWVVDRFFDALNRPKDWHVANNSFFPEKQLLRLDISKASDRLHWQPVLSVDDGVRYTADWYAAFLDGADLYKISLDQLHHYEKIACVKSL